MKLAVAGLVAGLLAGAVAWPNWSLRAQMRTQVLVREGRTLLALVDLQRTLEAERLREGGTDPATLDEWLVALQTTRLAGVIALRVFADDAPQRTLPIGIVETTLTPADRAQAQQRLPVARFHPEFRVGELFDLPPVESDPRIDCLEVIVPVSAPGDALVVAQYWIDAAPVAAEFAALDAQIWRRALGVWALATLLALAILAWAAHRLERTLRALARADQELTMAAKSSALGAVTAHLMHGLRNPLAALRRLAAERPDSGGDEEARARRLEVAQLTERMRGIVDEVTGLLHDESHQLRYELSPHEVWDRVRDRLGPDAARVIPRWETDAGAVLEGRTAGLVALVLVNLAQNACEAAPGDATVEVTWRSENGKHDIEVADHGPGLPAEVRERLFSPVPSSRTGGAGIGLAISRRLAAHAGGELGLVRSDGSGTVFRLTLPAAVSGRGRTD